MRVLVTGGCGFIGSAAVRFLVGAGHHVLNLDKLTYAGDLRTVAAVAGSPNYRFRKMDILDQRGVAASFKDFAPQAVFHLAAESHVDRSIDDPGIFVDTNLRGTFVMLHTALNFWNQLNREQQANFRFIQVSTDEVYGSLGAEGFFTETTVYGPNSPYSASKAGADHLARAWYTTYGLPTIISNCSNNYGPFQNREKLIPTIIRKALSSQTIPIYGQGQNVRDWLYVDDHIAALLAICEKGKAGSSYNIGGYNEISNIDLATAICALLDRRRPRSDGRRHAERIQFVTDRPGHDYRYAIDAAKAKRDLGWQPQESLQSGLSKTVDWYLDHLNWTMDVVSSEDRLGLGSLPKPLGEDR
ncbi:dTDP-glucose 4,6-dehydratase [Bradyrhizobium australiense]|uniref:dTDP-glucose 4,6-dehydratase n=1 Tax=Bradyrhizobium australiense TaxID=2721161 RepID=A0A7Y4LYF7_9BRAD|nr:dTDP-glucose 4,6-dehydratase [Bradyrhizobium australiense]NOJ43547.1 dTDP-glucose 4,6-dehydratase [Bradyrhizobium australiense]